MYQYLHVNSSFSNCKNTPGLVSTQEVLAVKTPLFSGVMLCSLVDTDQCLQGICSIHLHALMKEVAGSSEMLANTYHTTSLTFYQSILVKVTTLRILNLLAMCMYGIRLLEHSSF
jgi:hypothetical protein